MQSAPLVSAVFVLSTLLATCAASAESPNIVFQDHFENGMERWEVLDPDTWRKNADGTVEITERESACKPPHRSPKHIALVSDCEIGAGAIEFRVKSTLDTGSHRDCCVFFGWQDPAHFYYVHLGAQPDPHSGQIMIVNDAPRKAMTENENPVPWTDGWHTVRVERELMTGRIAVFFDSKLLMETYDKTFGKGRIGIGSFDDRNAFDDLVIEQGK